MNQAIEKLELIKTAESILEAYRTDTIPDVNYLEVAEQLFSDVRTEVYLTKSDMKDGRAYLGYLRHWLRGDPSKSFYVRYIYAAGWGRDHMKADEAQQDLGIVWSLTGKSDGEGIRLQTDTKGETLDFDWWSWTGLCDLGNSGGPPIKATNWDGEIFQIQGTRMDDRTVGTTSLGDKTGDLYCKNNSVNRDFKFLCVDYTGETHAQNTLIFKAHSIVKSALKR